MRLGRPGWLLLALKVVGWEGRALEAGKGKEVDPSLELPEAIGPGDTLT